MVKILLVGSWYTKHIVRLCGKLGATKCEDESLEAFDTFSFYDKRADVPKGIESVYGLKPFFLSRILIKIPKVRALVKDFASVSTFKSLISNNSYNLVSFQAASPVTAKLIKIAHKKGIKTHVAPLGSEVLRVNWWQNTKLQYIFRNSDYVSASTFSDFGRNLIKKYDIPEERCVAAGYGSDIITEILHEDRVQTKEELSELLNIPYSSYYIACGYCANREQNHKEILYALAENKTLLPSNYLIVIQLSYGVFKKELYQELSDLAKQLELNVYFIRDFLTTEQVIYLRKLIDLFIHVQKSDATNASILEYLLCDTTIINGAWLKYSYLESKGFPYYICNSMEELPQCVNRVLSGSGGEIVDASNYRSAIARMKDWTQALERWHTFFHRNISKNLSK